jgi:hypothetical protein
MTKLLLCFNNLSIAVTSSSLASYLTFYNAVNLGTAQALLGGYKQKYQQTIWINFSAT